jgi:hypothetical protein
MVVAGPRPSLLKDYKNDNEMKYSRKIPFSFSLVLVSFFAHGQFAKGTFSIGGSISGNYSTSQPTSYFYPSTTFYTGSASAIPAPIIIKPDKRTYSILVIPEIGYFVSNNLNVGLGLGLAIDDQREEYSSYLNTSNYKTWVIEPYARYYFHSFYFQGSLGLGETSNERSSKYSLIDGNGSILNFSSQVNGKSTSWHGALAVGKVFLINKNVGIETSIGYRYKTISINDSSLPNEKSGTFYLGTGLQLFLNKRQSIPQ